MFRCNVMLWMETTRDRETIYIYINHFFYVCDVHDVLYRVPLPRINQKRVWVHAPQIASLSGGPEDRPRLSLEL